MVKKALSLAPLLDSVTLDTLKGFTKLEVQDKDVVTENHRALLVLRHNNKYEMGQRLSKIRAILKPLRLYEVYLKTELKESRATANRAVAYYKRVQALPAPVRQVVIERAVVLSPKRVDAFPPPEGNDEEEINTWVDMQEQGTGRKIQIQAREDSPDRLIGQNITEIKRNLKKIPKKLKGQYITQLAGMALTLGGMSAQRIDPVAIPEIKRGRPRLDSSIED